MKLSRTGTVASLALVSALGLTACGSDSQDTPSAGGSGAAVDKANCATGDLKGAGSTFQANIVSQWTKDFGASCSGANVDYQGVGSGTGITQFLSKTIDFAGSDRLLKDDEATKATARCGGAPAVHIPVTAGAISLAYNLQGVDSLQLSPATVAGIFQGTITKWDDAAVKADNPGATLPSTAISPVHRSDASGTTDVFGKFETATAKDAWTLGTGQELKWPASVQGAPKSDGVTQAVTSTDGGITYVEQSYATANMLKVAKVKNGAGEYTEPTQDAVSAALAGATVKPVGSDLPVTYDFANTTKGAYPISAVSYEIVCSKGTDAAKLDLLKKFLTYDVTTGQSAAGGLGFAPLPDAIATAAKTAIAALA